MIEAKKKNKKIVQYEKHIHDEYFFLTCVGLIRGKEIFKKNHVSRDVDGIFAFIRFWDICPS